MSQLYPKKHIVIALVSVLSAQFSDTTNGPPGAILGCALPDRDIITLAVYNNVVDSVRTLTHELLHLRHLGGFGEDQLDVALGILYSSDQIPPEWKTRIQTAAQWFAPSS